MSTNASICRGPASRCDVNVVAAALVERRVPMDAPGMPPSACAFYGCKQRSLLRAQGICGILQRWKARVCGSSNQIPVQCMITRVGIAHLWRNVQREQDTVGHRDDLCKVTRNEDAFEVRALERAQLTLQTISQTWHRRWRLWLCWRQLLRALLLAFVRPLFPSCKRVRFARRHCAHAL